MKSVVVVLLSLFFVQLAQAKKYECRMQERVDPWTNQAQGDLWTAYVDDVKGVVELHSDNSIFGDNPFAILNQTSANGVAAGTSVFKGFNRYEDDSVYLLKLDSSKQFAGMDSWEGKNASRELNGFECRPFKGPFPRE